MSLVHDIGALVRKAIPGARGLGLDSVLGKLPGVKGATTSLAKTASGATTLLAAADHDRIVLILVHVTTVFADGDGAQPVFLFGETGDTDKFDDGSLFNDAADESRFVLHGTLAADKALLITATAATGSTSTGALTATVIAAPAA